LGRGYLKTSATHQKTARDIPTRHNESSAGVASISHHIGAFKHPARFFYHARRSPTLIGGGASHIWGAKKIILRPDKFNGKKSDPTFLLSNPHRDWCEKQLSLERGAAPNKIRESILLSSYKQHETPNRGAYITNNHCGVGHPPLM